MTHDAFAVAPDDDEANIVSSATDEKLSAQQIKAEAGRLGFSACGLAKAAPVDEARAELRKSLIAQGCHGEMEYLARNLDKRLDPRLLFPGVKTIVSVALNYHHDFPKEGYRLAGYAHGKDYHDLMRSRLRQLVERLGWQLFFPNVEQPDALPPSPLSARVFVDTAPVDERYWAWKAGIGWMGRSGLLVLPEGGTHFFLGEIMVCAEADAYDEPMPEQCGECRHCVKACPGKALRGDGTMDARKCLSYLTIEQRGALPDGTGQKMGNCIYGCDICSDVCPYNQTAATTTVEELLPSADLLAMQPEDWQQLTVEQYRKLFKGSAVKRAKYEGLMRNIRAVAERRGAIKPIKTAVDEKK